MASVCQRMLSIVYLMHCVVNCTLARQGGQYVSGFKSTSVTRRRGLLKLHGGITTRVNTREQ